MNHVTIRARQPLFPVAEDLYGLFFEDINRAGDGGLYPELLRNRSFEDSLVPDGCTLRTVGESVELVNENGWSCPFNGGEGKLSWARRVSPTPIPAWYADKAVLSLDAEDRLNERRRVSLLADFAPGGMLRNIGYNGVPLKMSDTYRFFMFAKADRPCHVRVSLADGLGREYVGQTFALDTTGFVRYECSLTAPKEDFTGTLTITAPEGGCIHLGFTSLMPEDTYKGHGLRKDLCEMLAQSHGRFLRFPGGCIVEGFSRETMMRFTNTIGPVWERPSHNLMWYYRTTNGLGFHEYLQLCEDLDIEAMYVINVGISCQVRGPVFAEGEELAGWLQDAFDAIDYATAAPDTPWGRRRAEAGHPAPFRLRYVEIGNENMGEAYFTRYRMFYDAIKQRYPQLILIANTHTEQEGLPTEVVDEHYYDTPAFFCEDRHRFDSCDRNGPKIFLGEYEAFQGESIATLYAALCESMYMLGVERNQDVVTLSAYAPMLQNADFTAWYPDLIVFNNHQTFGSASYHMLALLGANRGKQVVQAQSQTAFFHFPRHGRPGLMSDDPGVRFRNAAFNGEPVCPGRVQQNRVVRQPDGSYMMDEDPAMPRARVFPGQRDTSGGTTLVFDAPDAADGRFEADVLTGAEGGVTLTMFNHAVQAYIFSEENDSDEVWNHRTVRNFRWQIRDGVSQVFTPCIWGDKPMSEPQSLHLTPGEYHHLCAVSTEEGFDCYVDGALLHHARQLDIPALDCAATVDSQTIYVKLLNITDAAETVALSLDEPVADEYEVSCLTADSPDAMNTFDDPRCVHVETRTLHGASVSFRYSLPAYSLHVLRLKRLSQKEGAQ